jgi:1,2-diacylglycerol 3-beta-glucosyltransferase
MTGPIPAFVFLLASILELYALLGSIYALTFAILGQQDAPVTQFPSEPCTRFLILVPAHNEENIIRESLCSLSRLEYPWSLIQTVIIADNCTDNTAAVVRGEGYECWERKDSALRGKGPALRWALDQARHLAYDAIIFIDADTVIEPGTLRRFDRDLRRGALVVQAAYEFQNGSDKGFSLLTLASKRAETQLIWAPRQRLGLTIFLQGNGFCVHREVMDRLPWNAFSIAEDLEYSLTLRLNGIKVHFVQDATVKSRMTRTVTDAFPQRLRWASGTFQLIAKYAPRLLWAAARQRDLGLLDACAALVTTSRADLFYANFLALGFSLFGSPAGMRTVLWSAVLVTTLFQLIYLLFVVRTISETSSLRRTLFSLPGYLGGLLITQLVAMLGLRRKTWTRADR